MEVAWTAGNAFEAPRMARNEAAMKLALTSKELTSSIEDL